MPRRTGPAPMERLPFRVGLGCDRHRFDPARALVLGGATLPGGPGLDGHSDADVLMHAACDALLGALGLPDMGLRFPSTDPRYKGASSRIFLDDAIGEVRRAGYAIANVDAVVFAEIPRLAPHLGAIRAALASALRLPAERVGVKAKKGEGLGWIGRSEGMAAQVIVLLSALPAGAPRTRTGRRPARPRRAGTRR